MSTDFEQPIRGEKITLGQLLKLLNLVGSGAEVKDFLASETVLVNGDPDNRRGRKLFAGDVVEAEPIGRVRIVSATRDENAREPL